MDYVDEICRICGVGYYRGFVVSANADGSYTVNSKIVHTQEEVDDVINLSYCALKSSVERAADILNGKILNE